MEDVDGLIARYKYPVAIGVVGIVLLIGGIISSGLLSKTFVKSPAQIKGNSLTNSVVVAVDVSGAVMRPGVYKLSNGARVEEAIKAAGGVTESADLAYLSQTVNLAQKVVDGMKIYIPQTQEAGPSGKPVLGASTKQSSLVNINSSSVSELDQLPGIGPISAQKIIDNRPYGSVEDLLPKKAVSRSVYEKIKGLVSVY